MKALLSLLAIAFCTTAQAQESRSCSIYGLTGTGGQLWRAGAPMPLAPALIIEHDDRISTDAATRVEVACDDGVVVVIGANSDIDLGELPGPRAGRGYAARLLEGIVGVVMPLFSGRRFEVRTPTAVASVRSTEWTVSVEGGATTVFVREGAVAVTARRGGAVLGAGEGIDVSAEGVAGPTRRWPAARVEATTARLGFGWE